MKLNGRNELEKSFAHFKSDKISVKVSSLDKIKRSPAIPDRLSRYSERKQINPNNLQIKANPLLNQLTKRLEAINKNCQILAEGIFKDNNYIDPNYKLYRNPDGVLSVMRKVFDEMLIQYESKEAFSLLKLDIKNTKIQGDAPSIWDGVLKNIDVCRENEVFYFFETMFESFRLEHFGKSKKRKVIQYFIQHLAKLLNHQQSMTNLLFITNLVIKSARSLSVDEYIISEGKKIFDDLVDFWRINAHYYQEQNNGQKKKAKGIDFYRDYIRQTEYYNQELRKVIEDLLL